MLSFWLTTWNIQWLLCFWTWCLAAPGKATLPWGKTLKCCTLTLAMFGQEWSCSKLHTLYRWPALDGSLDVWFRDAILDCTLQLRCGCCSMPHDEKSPWTFPAQKGDQTEFAAVAHLQTPTVLTAGISRPDPAVCLQSQSHSSKPGWTPSIAIPLFPSKMHPPCRDGSYWREIEIAPIISEIWTSSKGWTSLCSSAVLWHSFCIGMMEVFSSKPILPIINPAQDELSLIRSNMRITFCHAETLREAIWIDADVEQEVGFFPCLDAALGLSSAGRHHGFYSMFLPNRGMVKRKKRKKIDRMKEVLGGSDCSVETYQSLKLRKDSV